MARPKCIDYLSPNFSPRDPGRNITCVILHATVGNKEPSLEWLCNPESKVSAHYLIDTLGAIYRLVDEQNIAWHAGFSKWQGKNNVNEFSIGIELVNPNDGTPYTADQVIVCSELVADICTEYRIKPSDVVGHIDIAPERKTDPVNFPWLDFRLLLAEHGVK